MAKIKSFFAKAFKSNIGYLIILGFVSLLLGQIKFHNYWENDIATIIDETELFVHLAMAFFIAIILEISNERVLRKKIVKGAKTSMKEVLAEVVKVLTKSDNVGKSLDKLLNKCTQFYRENYEIYIKFTKKNSNTFIVDVDLRYDIFNQTNEKLKHECGYGSDEDKFKLSEFYINNKLMKPLNPTKVTKYGRIGYEYSKEINISPKGKAHIRLVARHEMSSNQKTLHELTFGIASMVKILKLEFEDKCKIDSSKINVLVKGIPEVTKKYDLEYTFEGCFLPFESLTVVHDS